MSTDRSHALGRQLRERRRSLRLTQDELADLAGCSPRFVRALEVGKPSVRLDKVLDVLDVLGLDLQLTPASSS
jgi:HTH-type transcriptional regulator / antitoxin HipB